MQLLLVLAASCLACVTAKPLLFLTYAGNNGSPRAAFFECAFPVPVYDEVNNRVTYRCPSRVPAPVALPQVSLVEVDALTDQQGNVELIEVIEEVNDDPGLHVGHTSQGEDVVVVPLDATRPQDSWTGSYLDNTNACPPGQVHVGELDICVDWVPPSNPPSDVPNKPNKPNKPKPNRPNRPGKPQKPKDKVLGPAQNQVKDDESIVPITIGQLPLPRCSSGEVYVAELDICVPYNNCWPHSDECDDD